MQKDYETAIQYQERVVEVLGELIDILVNWRDLKVKGNAYDKLGSLYAETGDKELAEEHYSEALEYYENSSKLCYDIGNKDDIATSLNNIGNVYRLQGELEKALENYKQSLSYWEAFGNIQFIS